MVIGKSIEDTRLARARGALAEVLGLMIEAQEALSGGLLADEREAILSAHDSLDRAKKAAYAELTMGDLQILLSQPCLPATYSLSGGGQ